MERRAPLKPAEAAAGLRIRPTPQGAVHLLFLLVFSVTVWVLGENLLFLLANFCLGGVAVAFALARRNVRSLRAVRVAPARSRVGAADQVVYRVQRGRGGSSVGVQLLEQEARGLKFTEPQRSLAPIPAGSECELSAAVVFPRRGRHTFSGLELRSRFPFGLFEARLSLPASAQTLVLPREGRASVTLRDQLRGPRPRLRHALRTRGNEELYGVMEYRPGDDPRRVHWKTSARRGLLVRTQWRDEPGSAVCVVLGSSRGSGAAFERAVSVAATVLRACRSEGLPVHLMLGDENDVPLGQPGGALATHLVRLSEVRPRRGRHPRKAAQTALAGHRPPALLYIATGAEPGLGGELRGSKARALVLRADQRAIRRFVRGLP